MNITTTRMKTERYGETLTIDVDGAPAGFFHLIGKRSPRDLAFRWIEWHAGAVIPRAVVFPMVDAFPTEAEVRCVLDKYRPSITTITP